MMHKPILLKNVSLSFPHKVCFKGFTSQISYGDRIAIIGRNGSGKSTLLSLLQGLIEPNEGRISVPEDVVFGYVPQLIKQFDSLSGGQRFNEALTQALALYPNILLLDEPTNHLDQSNRRSLIRMLSNYQGTLIVVTHDVEVLRACVDTLWHIDNGKVTIFSGNYDDYAYERALRNEALVEKISCLKKQQKKVHVAATFEQERAEQSQRANAHENDRILKGAMKEKGSRTAGKNRSKVAVIKDQIDSELGNLFVPEVIMPTFSLSADDTTKVVVTVREGACGYDGEDFLLNDISFSIGAQERVALLGDNGSGKSTFVKALLQDSAVVTSGSWAVPGKEAIGYLDQQYGTLEPNKTVLETMQDEVPTLHYTEIRRHLNDFLFRKNEEVTAYVHMLSGGEKARFSLAQIAAKTPKLLILDEITNNLDLETREHVILVLMQYPGSLIVISHDENFLKAINITSFYIIKNQSIELLS